MSKLFNIIKTLARLCFTPLLIMEQKRLRGVSINERIVEFSFAFKWLSKICPLEVLDVGSGTGSWPHIIAHCGCKVTAIDKIGSYWKDGFFNRLYYVANDDITKARTTKQFDLITCISVLEHIPDHRAAISGMFGLLKPGGILVLTFPYNEKRYIDNVYKLSGSECFGENISYICQMFSREQIDNWLKENPGTAIIEQEYYKIFSGDFWTFGGRIYPPRKVEKGQKCHLTCIVFQKNRI